MMWPDRHVDDDPAVSCVEGLLPEAAEGDAEQGGDEAEADGECGGAERDHGGEQGCPQERCVHDDGPVRVVLGEFGEGFPVADRGCVRVDDFGLRVGGEGAANGAFGEELAVGGDGDLLRGELGGDQAPYDGAGGAEDAAGEDADGADVPNGADVLTARASHTRSSFCGVGQVPAVAGAEGVSAPRCRRRGWLG